jgi:hypothetical protein
MALPAAKSAVGSAAMSCHAAAVRWARRNVSKVKRVVSSAGCRQPSRVRSTRETSCVRTLAQPRSRTFDQQSWDHIYHQVADEMSDNG